MDGNLGGFAAGVWRGGRRCAFAGGSVWTSLGHLVGLTPVRNKSETQCYHDLRRPGSAVRMFMRPFVWAECAQHIHVNVPPGCFQIRRVRPRNTLAPFVRVRCAAKMTILAHLERRAVHMEPRTWPSQTCFVSLLGFVSFSTYFSIRNQLQLVTLWKWPRTLSIGCVWMASWVDSPQVCGDGAGAALLRGARCGQASVTWWV